MTIETINISEIRERIDSQIGKSKLVIPGVANHIVNKVLDSNQYDDYLQDQVYRWVITTYLVNAKLQGYISETEFEGYVAQAKTAGGREQLAASVILSGVPLVGSMPQLEYVSIESEEPQVPELSLVSH